MSKIREMQYVNISLAILNSSSLIAGLLWHREEKPWTYGVLLIVPWVAQIALTFYLRQVSLNVQTKRGTDVLASLALYLATGVLIFVTFGLAIDTKGNVDVPVHMAQPEISETRAHNVVENLFVAVGALDILAGFFASSSTAEIAHRVALDGEAQVLPPFRSLTHTATSLAFLVTTMVLSSIKTQWSIWVETVLLVVWVAATIILHNDMVSSKSSNVRVTALSTFFGVRSLVFVLTIAILSSSDISHHRDYLLLAGSIYTFSMIFITFACHITGSLLIVSNHNAGNGIFGATIFEARAQQNDQRIQDTSVDVGEDDQETRETPVISNLEDVFEPRPVERQV